MFELRLGAIPVGVERSGDFVQLPAMTRNEQPIDPDELNSERLHDERTDRRLRVVGVNEDLNIVDVVDEATTETVQL